MGAPQPRQAFEGFFLDAPGGRRFCVFRGPPPGVACRGALVHVPAFAEEMNKSRRMVAEAARALAGAGWASLQLDLHGCGDSDGDFGDARWEGWLDDVAAASDWLGRHTGVRPGLWGLRTGALLAADAAAGRVPAERLVAWQPVANGERFLTQFLRMKVAGERLGGDAQADDTRALRARLAGGASIEVGGYALSPALAAALDRARLGEMRPACGTIHWLEVGSAAAASVGPASTRVVEAWRGAGCAVDVRVVQGEPFWTTVEIAECPALIEATLACLREAA